jgi:hypothetical protein
MSNWHPAELIILKNKNKKELNSKHSKWKWLNICPFSKLVTHTQANMGLSNYRKIKSATFNCIPSIFVKQLISTSQFPALSFHTKLLIEKYINTSKQWGSEFCWGLFLCRAECSLTASLKYRTKGISFPVKHSNPNSCKPKKGTETFSTNTCIFQPLPFWGSTFII